MFKKSHGPIADATVATPSRRRSRLAGVLIGAAVLAGGVAVTAGAASAQNCLTCVADGGGAGGAGGTSGGAAGTSHNTISYSVRTDLGYGHVMTNSGYLDRTTSQLYGTVKTEADWWLFGWHGASLVTIYDNSGHMIWVSPVEGPYGVDGGATPVLANYTGVPVPLSITQHAAQIEVVNYWSPQWTALTQFLGGIGQLGTAVIQYCTTNPGNCAAAAGAIFGPLLA